MDRLKAPFPYFGGKSQIADVIWQRLGDCRNYVEPFFGSGAVLLARPDEHEWWRKRETVNDADGFICNFWRAVQHDPEEVARWADWPINECDLTARHWWLTQRREDITGRLRGDPDWYDAKVAGWWVWGISCWIGGGWCTERGPWVVREGVLVRGNDPRCGIGSKRPDVGRNEGMHRLSLLGSDANMDNVCDAWHRGLAAYIQRLANRLRSVRVCCGDWTRVVGRAATKKHGLTGVFLDPPYSRKERDARCYGVDTDCAAEVREWCLQHGDDPLFRIALCGYEAEGHEVLQDAGWSVYAWTAHGGWGNRGQGRAKSNTRRERVWFSPYCLLPSQPTPADAQLSIDA